MSGFAGRQQHWSGVGPFQHTTCAGRHPWAEAGTNWLSFICQSLAAAEGRVPVSHSRPQAAAQLCCCPQRRRREQPFHCCCCRLASPGASWRCPAVWRAPLCRQNLAPVLQPLQGRKGGVGGRLGGQHGQMHRHWHRQLQPPPPVRASQPAGCGARLRAAPSLHGCKTRLQSAPSLPAGPACLLALVAAAGGREGWVRASAGSGPGAGQLQQEQWGPRRTRQVSECTDHSPHRGQLSSAQLRAGEGMHWGGAAPAATPTNHPHRLC